MLYCDFWPRGTMCSEDNCIKISMVRLFFLISGSLISCFRNRFTKKKKGVFDRKILKPWITLKSDCFNVVNSIHFHVDFSEKSKTKIFASQSCLFHLVFLQRKEWTSEESGIGQSVHGGATQKVSWKYQYTNSCRYNVSTMSPLYHIGITAHTYMLIIKHMLKIEILTFSLDVFTEVN